MAKIREKHIEDKAVILAKMDDMATASVIYRKTAGTGVPEVQTLSTLKADMNITGDTDWFDRDGNSDIQPIAGDGSSEFAFEIDSAGGLQPVLGTWTDETDYDADGNGDIQPLAT